MIHDKVSRLALASALGTAVLAAPSQLAAQEAQRRPNIIVIIADDVGLDEATGMYPGLVEAMSRAYGPQGRNHPQAQRITGHPASTPVLNRFAQQGMVFSQAWAHPFCSPTRAAILTGLYAKNTGVATYADPLSQVHHSFVTDLHDAGYRTGVFGKWHMAGLPGQPRDYPGMKPKEAGFDMFYGNMHAALPTYWDYPVQVQDTATAPGEWRTEAAKQHSLPGIAPTLMADVGWVAEATDWIRQQELADPDKPWFTWLAFNLAHATARQQPSAMMVPDRDTLDAATIAEMEACGGEFGTQNTGTCSGEALMRAMTNAMDTLVGKVLDVVDQVDPNTYVIVLGDNGTPMYGRPNLDFIDNLYITRTGRGKGSPFESGAHVEMAVRGPGIAAGSHSDEFVHVVDLFPTVLQLAGLSVPHDVPNIDGSVEVPLDGISLKPILTGTAQAVRDPVRGYVLNENTNLMANNTKFVGARNRGYKVDCTNSTESCLFYDLTRDPLEEYPIEPPQSCDVTRPESDPTWNYCYLTGVIREKSIF